MATRAEHKSLFVKHYHSIPPSYGGVQVYVKRLMLALCQKGMVSGAFMGERFEGMPKEYKYLLDEFPRHSRSLFILPEFYKLIRCFQKYKIIHAHTSFTTVFGVWLSHKVLHKPVVYTVHNQMIDQQYKLLNFIDRYCIRSLARDSKVQFTTVNEKSKTELENKKLKFKNNIIVMPAYIPPIEIGEYADYLPREMITFINRGQKILLYYAESFAEYNGKDIYGTKEVIDVFCKIKEVEKNVNLIFCLSNVGNSVEKINELKSTIKEVGFEEDVYWQIGAISEMWPLLKVATALLRPTITDGDSIMVREALAYGLPVITTDAAKRPEGCIVYPVGNQLAFASKTIKIVRHPYKKEYPQENFTNKMIDIYYRLLDND